jgi:hypothetical protein
MMMNKVLFQLTQNAVPKYFFDLLFSLVNQHRRYLCWNHSNQQRDGMTGRLSAVGSAATSFPFSFTEQTNNEIVEKIRKNVLGNMRLGSCSSSSSQFCFFVFDSHAGLALSGRLGNDRDPCRDLHTTKGLV